MSSRCRASLPCAAAFSTSTRRKPRARYASSCSATKLSRSATSIRKTQRSAGAVDEVVLLPLSDTPVREDILGAIHARLSGRRLEADEETLEQIARAEGVTVFPGLGVLRRRDRRPAHLRSHARMRRCCATIPIKIAVRLRSVVGASAAEPRAQRRGQSGAPGRTARFPGGVADAHRNDSPGPTSSSSACSPRSGEERSRCIRNRRHASTARFRRWSKK